MPEPFGFDHPEQRRRRTTGRRLGDRRVMTDRRVVHRRIEIVPIVLERRGEIDRRSGFERRRIVYRRVMDERRDSAWTGLEE